MNEKIGRYLRYYTGVVFAFAFLSDLLALVGSFTFYDVLAGASSLLMSIALFANIPLLAVVGAGVSVVFNLGRIISFGEYMPPYIMIGSVIWAATFLLMALAVVNKKSTVKLCFLVGLLPLVGEFFLVFFDVWGYSWDVVEKLSYILSQIRSIVLTGCVPFVALVGMVLGNSSKEFADNPTSSNTTTLPQNAAGSSEKLIQLKTLLDTGAITQEEFNEKKKQILGL